MKNFFIIKKILICLTVYLFYCGVSVYIYTIYNINEKTEVAKKKEVKSLDTILQSQPGNEKISITGDIDDALPLRCQLVDAAEKTLLISQYTIGDDDSGLIFIGKVFEAAQRGVKVKLLMNGLSSKMTNASRIPLAIFEAQPNIEVKMVGGIDLLRPWRMNNVMHDKLIIADDKYFMSSGRNIQQRFMLASDEREPVYDLDVVVQKQGLLTEHSLINQGKEYFDKLWRNPYAVNKKSHGDWVPRFVIKKAVAGLDSNIFNANKRHRELLSRKVLENMDFQPVESGYLVHNSVGSLVKEPMVWRQLTQLMNESEHKLMIASPYMVFTRKMQSFLKTPLQSSTEFLTNSSGNSPNIFAFGGYLNQKKWLLKDALVLEYQGHSSLHQKALLIDGKIGIAGSFNFDSRSAYLSSENMLIVNSSDFHDQLKKILDEYKNNSLTATGNFDYEEGKGAAAYPVSQAKKRLLLILSWITKPFSFLL